MASCSSDRGDHGSDKELTILDPETNMEYTLILNNDDYDRAQTDEKFISMLLSHAKDSNINNNTEEHTFEESQPEICTTGIGTGTRIVQSWSYNQTVELIKSMATHLSDLYNAKKRKFVYEHVVNDLTSAGYSVTSIAVQNKWKSLQRSYSKSKDNVKRTGQAPSRFLFYDLMDELLGTKPSHQCDHSINSEIISEENEHDKESESQNISDTDNSLPDSRPETPSTFENTPTTSKKRIRISEKRIRQEGINIKVEEYKRRNVRHEEKVALEKEKIEIEKKKLQLLEEIIKKM